MEDMRPLAQTTMAWPFEEARKIIHSLEGKAPSKGFVLFETGYGPSGLPHIGTFGEVVRTTMVRQAFALLSDIPTKLYAISDDMDGLRKIPDNVPNGEMIREHLGKPLTRIPDPFGTHESFGHHNNARLRAFLDTFKFDYEFISSSECYNSGKFDPMLLSVLAHYEEIINVILPTLREERRATYSPFLPICAETGRVLQAPVVERDEKMGTIVYQRDDGKLIETPVTGGHCKLQWKVDWGMRWAAFGVDYEMSGKDLIDSVRLSSQVCKILGYRPPEGFNYELFLDADGTKISKSKGNGLTIEEWLQYAPEESLAYFMYQSPRKAKRLYFDVIPRAVDEYLNFLEKFPEQTLEQKLNNPAWHVHEGKPPREELPLSFAILLNLASVTNTEDKAVLWGFISRYARGANPEAMPMVDRLVEYAIAYYRDFVKPHKHYRVPTEEERKALEDLAQSLKGLAQDPEAIQTEVFEVGKRHHYTNLRDWFKALYQILLGQDEGPRMGSFIALYGVEETTKLISEVLKKEK
ncbi:MAG: lysine--tRNA ligase [Alphaproteobacteria bacterium]|nr:lysine--tRNA ligase [Alphaproteobacteria bacterium]